MAKRRARGEGTIVRRKDGVWCAAIRLPNGRRKFLYAKSRKAAADKLFAARKALSEGRPVDPSKITVADFLERWLHDAVATSLRPRTVEHYEYAVRNLIVPGIGDIHLGKLTPLEIQTLLGKQKSSRKRLTAYTILRRALEQAADWGLIGSNPAHRVARPRHKTKEMRSLGVAEAQRLIEVVTGDRLEAFYILAITCGFRFGELAGLQWRDVDWRRRMISVRRVISEGNDGPDFGEPKSAAGKRAVAVPQLAMVSLKRHRGTRVPPATELIFHDRKGGPLRRGNFARRDWGPIREKAGLGKLRFHELRHTAATLALASGTDANTAQERLGHSSPAFTLSVYGHVLEGAQRATADSLDEILGT